MMNEQKQILSSRWKQLLVLLLIFNALAWATVTQVSGAKGLKVVFFDVGQGDAIFVETAQGNQVLIDGGPDSTILEKLGSEMPFYDRTIELIIITHPHQDHIAGLVEVLRRYQVEQLLMPGIEYESQAYQELLRVIEKKEISASYAQAGQTIWVDDYTLMKVLYPLASLLDISVKEANDSSIVASLIYGETEFLFTGDASSEVEQQVLQTGTSVDTDVLKVGHHGAKTSSSDTFLSTVSPEYAVISAGADNRYGHPHQETLDRITSHGTTVLRTDDEGDIVFFSNGREPWRVRSK